MFKGKTFHGFHRFYLIHKTQIGYCWWQSINLWKRGYSPGFIWKYTNFVKFIDRSFELKPKIKHYNNSDLSLEFTSIPTTTMEHWQSYIYLSIYYCRSTLNIPLSQLYIKFYHNRSCNYILYSKCNSFHTEPYV